MSKSNLTANDAQLKARRTSLEKKSKDDLISIILRKDGTERKNNAKIKELNDYVNLLCENIKERDTRIKGFEMDMKGMKEILKTKQETIDSVILKKNAYSEEAAEFSRKYVNMKNIAYIRKKVIYMLFVTIATLITLLVLG